jgi:hypothetical protein
MHKSFPTRGRYKSCGENLGELKQRVLAKFRVTEFQHQLLRRRHLLVLGRLAQGGAAAAPSHRRGRRRRGPGERGGNGEGRLQVRHLTSTAPPQRNIDHHELFTNLQRKTNRGERIDRIELTTHLIRGTDRVSGGSSLRQTHLQPRRLTGAEAEAASTRNGRRNQSHHERRAATLQQTLRSVRYGRIGQAKEEEEDAATNDGEPAICRRRTGGERSETTRQAEQISRGLWLHNGRSGLDGRWDRTV